MTPQERARLRLVLLTTCLSSISCGCPTVACEDFFEGQFVTPAAVGPLRGATVTVRFNNLEAACELPAAPTSTLQCAGLVDAGAALPSLFVRASGQAVTVQIFGAAPSCVSVNVATSAGQAEFFATAQYGTYHAGDFACAPQCVRVNAVEPVSSCSTQ
jgi:hypothetical protein